jgi:hypothetical protein
MFFVLSSAVAYSGASADDLNLMLQDFTSMKYIWLASTDLLYQGTTLFTLMLLGLILTNLYFEDFKTGCYKYIIISGVKKENFFACKVLFTFIVSITFAVFSFLCVTIIGIIFWGTNEINIKELGEAFLFYILAVIPIASFCFLLYDIALIIKNIRIVNFIAVVTPLIMGLVDSLTSSKKISPVGLLTIFNQKPPTEYMPDMSGYIIIESIWMVVFILINFILQKHYQDTI